MAKTEEEKRQSKILSNRKYRRNNIERTRASGREWYHKNKDKAREWYSNNKELAASTSRRNKLKARYGIDEDYVNCMIEEQEGRCKICDSESRLVVDHDHQTGKVRGMLCANCNTGIGMLNDDPSRMLKAIEYLSKAHHYDMDKTYENLSADSICN